MKTLKLHATEVSKNKNGQKNLKLYLFIEMYLFQKIKNRLELYSIEQGSQTVDIKALILYFCEKYDYNFSLVNSKHPCNVLFCYA